MRAIEKKNPHSFNVDVAAIRRDVCFIYFPPERGEKQAIGTLSIQDFVLKSWRTTARKAGRQGDTGLSDYNVTHDCERSARTHAHKHRLKRRACYCQMISHDVSASV